MANRFGRTSGRHNRHPPRFLVGKFPRPTRVSEPGLRNHAVAEGAQEELGVIESLWAIVALIELVEKGADADLVREILAFAAEPMMEAEVQVLTSAAHATCAAAGSAQRLSEARVGDESRPCQSGDPAFAQGILFPSFLELRRTAEKALTAVIREAYVTACQELAIVS